MDNHQNPSAKEIKQMIANGQKPMMFYHIPKSEILAKDMSSIDKLLRTVQEVGKGAKRSLVLTVNGYDDTTDELYEIMEVREFVEVLFNKHPHLFYYLSSFGGADDWILCSLADEIRSVSHGQKYTGNQLFEKFGLNSDEIPKVHAYITYKGDKLSRLLKAVMKHGKLKKDVFGSKKIALEYAMRFDDSDETMERLFKDS
jgi:hypothetical protein